MDLLDGACGLELKRRMAQGAAYNLTLFSTAALRDTPEAIAQLHRDYVRAGCTVITTATYAATEFYLDKIGEGSRVAELAERAVRLARTAIRTEKAEARVRVAACVPPLGESYQPASHLTNAEKRAQYLDLAHALRGCDLFLVETMATLEEATLAAKCCREVAPDLPLWISFNPTCMLSSAGRPSVVGDGASIASAVDAASALGAEAILFNCATPACIAAAVDEAVSAASGRLRVGGYANFWEEHDPRGWSIDLQESASNAGDRKPGGMVVRSDLTHELYAEAASEWQRAGASIVGGCCGIGPECIRECGLRCSIGGLARTRSHAGKRKHAA